MFADEEKCEDCHQAWAELEIDFEEPNQKKMKTLSGNNTFNTETATAEFKLDSDNCFLEAPARFLKALKRIQDGKLIGKTGGNGNQQSPGKVLLFHVNYTDRQKPPEHGSAGGLKEEPAFNKGLALGEYETIEEVKLERESKRKTEKEAKRKEKEAAWKELDGVQKFLSWFGPHPETAPHEYVPLISSASLPLTSQDAYVEKEAVESKIPEWLPIIFEQEVKKQKEYAILVLTEFYEQKKEAVEGIFKKDLLLLNINGKEEDDINKEIEDHMGLASQKEALDQLLEKLDKIFEAQKRRILKEYDWGEGGEWKYGKGEIEWNVFVNWVEEDLGLKGISKVYHAGLQQQHDYSWKLRDAEETCEGNYFFG